MTTAHNLVLFGEEEVKGKVKAITKGSEKEIDALYEKLKAAATDSEKLEIWKKLNPLEKGPSPGDLLDIIKESDSYEELGDHTWGFCQGWRYMGFAHVFVKTFKKFKESKLLEELLSDESVVFGVKTKEIITGYLSTKDIQKNGAKLIDLLKEFDIKKNLEEIEDNTDTDIGGDEKKRLEYLEGIRKASIKAIEKALTTKRSLILVSL